MARPNRQSPLCSSGKRGFATLKEAQAELRHIRAVQRLGKLWRRPGHQESSAYYCKSCCWWHLTSARGRRSRRSDHAA